MLYNKNVSISDAEMEVMRVIWDASEPLTSNEIMYGLKYNNWKPSTIFTLIKRLQEKNFLKLSEPCKQRNKSYIAALTEQEYQKIQTSNFIDKIFMGSAKNMIASLFDSGDEYSKDLAEIKEWLATKGDG